MISQGSRPSLGLVSCALCAVIGLVWLLHSVSAATREWVKLEWILLVWAVALCAAALAASEVSRTVRGLSLWLASVPLATMMHGAAAPALWSLAAALLSVGLAQVLNVPSGRGDDPAPTELPEIILTELDLLRLTRVLAGLSSSQRAAQASLEGELSRARVVPSRLVPADLVTMNTRLVFEDVHSGLSREAVLVYPSHEDPDRGRLSVLGPVGSALIGLRVGQSIDWMLPRGERKRYRIVNVLYQPEAAGDFHL